MTCSGLLSKGAGDAAALGYVPLPTELVDQIEQYWAKRCLPETESWRSAKAEPALRGATDV